MKAIPSPSRDSLHRSVRLFFGGYNRAIVDVSLCEFHPRPQASYNPRHWALGHTTIMRLLSALLYCSFVGAARWQDTPLKVLIIAGQSNRRPLSRPLNIELTSFAPPSDFNLKVAHGPSGRVGDQGGRSRVRTVGLRTPSC